MTAGDKDKAKWAAAEGAMQFVKDGLRIGLGTGSTAEKFVELLGRRCREEGWHVVCVPTSEATRAQAERLGLALDGDYPDFRALDIVVDGADEIDGKGNLTKGGGGALLREKYVASAAEKMIVIVDEAKHVDKLGSTFRIPVEVTAFAWSNTLERLGKFADKVELRKRGDQVFVTDQGNYIADCTFASIDDPAELHRQLKGLLGVVETGIFSGLAKVCVTGRTDGSFSVQEF